VNRSGELFTLHAAGPWLLAAGRPQSEPAASSQRQGASIFLGLQNIKSLATELVHRLLHERRRHGPFTGLPDLLHRVPLPVDQARMLIRAGALRFTGRTKPQLLWDLTLLHPGAKVTERGADLFITTPPETKLPELQHFDLTDAYDELELLGFPLCDPFLLVEEAAGLEPRATDLIMDRPVASGLQPKAIAARDMPPHIGRTVTMLGYVVHVKPTRTGTGERMSFGSFIDPAGDFWDSTQFPDVEARYPFHGRGVYRLTGKVEEEFGHCSLAVQRIEKLPWKQDPRYGEK